MTRTTIACMMVMLMAVTVGCARQEQPDQASVPETDVPADSAAMPDVSGTAIETEGTEGSAPADTNAPVSGTAVDIRSQLRSEAQRLNRAVAAGNLVEAGASALRLRDAAVALSGKTSGLPAERVQELEAQLTNIVQATETIRSRAAANELAGVRTENAQLQAMVAQVLKLMPA